MLQRASAVNLSDWWSQYKTIMRSVEWLRKIFVTRQESSPSKCEYCIAEYGFSRPCEVACYNFFMDSKEKKLFQRRNGRREHMMMKTMNE
jgi:hypothetical protein